MAGGHVWQGGGVCVAGGMHGRGTCMAGGMYDGGACMAGGHAWQGGECSRGVCMAWGQHGGWEGGGHAWHMVNEWAVRILLECILVLKYFSYWPL